MGATCCVGEREVQTGQCESETANGIPPQSTSGIATGEVCDDTVCNISQDDAFDAQVHELMAIVRATLGDRWTPWLQEWCTLQRMQVYLHGRQGNVKAAADLVSKALIWRQQNQDLLTGLRHPRWQGDMRIIAQGDSGHPLLYASHRFQTESYNQEDMVEHAAMVLEACQSSESLDVVLDLKDFQLRYNLDPRGAIQAAQLLKYAYRDSLRNVLIIDAPFALNAFWMLVKPTLPQGTQRKVHFLSLERAVLQIKQLQGSCSAIVLQTVMKSNREGPGAPGAVPKAFPSEVSLRAKKQRE